MKNTIRMAILHSSLLVLHSLNSSLFILHSFYHLAGLYAPIGLRHQQIDAALRSGQRLD